MWDSWTNEPVYRFFPQHEWAENFCAGSIRVSTLDACRKLEDKNRRDEKEGYLQYNSGDAFGNSGDPGLDLVVRRMDIVMVDCQNTTIRNSRNITLVPDAFVLCFSSHERPPPEAAFGAFGVRVNDPFALFCAITEQLALEQPGLRTSFGAVTYSDLEYTGLQSVPGIPGLLKRTPYSVESEVRMLWVPPRGHPPLTWRDVECPTAMRHCEPLHPLDASKPYEAALGCRND